MRDGLKKRIQFNPSNPSRLNYSRNDYIARNSFNSRIGNPNCFSNGCSNVQDASGYWVGNKQQNQQTSRNYYAPFRQPVKGYRKILDCSGTASNNCMFTTEIYKDTYSDVSSCQVCANNGSISTSKVPLLAATRASSGYTTRTKRPLIRSGMQPNVAGHQNSGIKKSLTATHYSYSYRELINNRRKDSYMKKLATEQPPPGTITTSGYGGNCPTINDCGPSKTIYKLNNNKFKVQGAVESSSRLERLKLETIRGSSNCPTGTYNWTNPDSPDCNGIYRPGHDGMSASGTNTWPLIDTEKMGCKSKVKYTSLFNNNHTEVNYPQTSALARARGAVRPKRRTTGRIIENNEGVCPTNCGQQFLM